MIIRVMGEIEIHCFERSDKAAAMGDISALAEIEAPTDADLVNWLGKALDDPAAPSLDEDESWRKQVEAATEILAAPALQVACKWLPGSVPWSLGPGPWAQSLGPGLWAPVPWSFDSLTLSCLSIGADCAYFSELLNYKRKTSGRIFGRMVLPVTL